MRFIRTTNAFVEFIEADNSGKILSSRGFQMGTVYFQIKNGKVTFYLNDTENPYQNDVWTTNIPLIIDDVEYATEDEVSNALHHIMNSNFQDQIDELSEDLAAESARAEASEAALDDAIDDERDRATSAETHLQSEVTELSGTVATYDDRITRAQEDARQAFEQTETEIARSTAKDAEHDTAISGLTTSVNNEIARALSAETSLHNEVLSEASRAQAAESGITANLNAEITNRQADVDAEEARAIAAESALTDAIDAEETAREAADGVISGAVDTLSTALSNEVQRAQNAESVLTNSINTVSGNVQSEIARATAMENAIDTKIDNEVTRATAKDAAHDAEISGLTTSLQNEITRATGAENSLRNDLNAEVSARTTADAAQLQRITALEVGKADANSVYTKSESDTLLAQKADKANAVATAEYVSQNKTINFKNINGTILSTIDATPFVVDGMVDDVRISGGNLVIVFNTDAGKQDIQIPLTDIFNPANYYDKTATDALLVEKLNTADFNTYSGVTKTAIDGKLNTSDFNTYSAATENVLENVYLKSETSGATQISSALAEKLDATAYTPTDLSNYYTKDETSGKTEISSALAEKLAVSDFNTYSGATDTLINSKASQTTVDALSGVVTSHTSNADVHVTTSDKQTWNSKQNALTAGSGISIQNDVITVTEVGITSGEVQSMIDSSISGKVNVDDNIVAPKNIHTYYDTSVTELSVDEFELYLKDGYSAYNTYQVNVDVYEENSSTWHNLYPIFHFYNGTYEGLSGNIIDIVWDSEKHSFKVSLSDSAPADAIIRNVYGLGDVYVTVVRMSTNSGQTADVVENDVMSMLDDLYMSNDKSVKNVSLRLYSDKFEIGTNFGNKSDITVGTLNLDDLKIEDNKLKTNIEVGTGVSAWTNVELTSICEIYNLPTNKFRISGDTTDMFIWRFSLYVENGGCTYWDSIEYNTDEQKFTVNSIFASDITLDWDAQNGVLTVEYPALSSSCSGVDRPIKIRTLNNSNCKLGTDLKSIECYGEIYLPIKDYVQATKADVDALSGTVATKQNQLIAGTGISIQNDVISVTASSPSVDAYTKAEADAKFATITNFNSHSGDTTMHVTQTEKNTWNAKSDFSGSYNDLTNKPTIPTSASQLTNDAGYITSSALNGYATEAYVDAAVSGKADSSTVSSLNNVVTAHTADNTAHVTSNEKQTWNNKPSVWSGSEQQWAAISGGTLDNNTIYLIY